MLQGLRVHGWVFRRSKFLLRSEVISQEIMSVFGSVVAVAFQIAFCAEIHANDVFLFFKNHF